jgi:hypothetical protein
VRACVSPRGWVRLNLIWSSFAPLQLVDKDPEKAIALFWSAINAGDRVDSALKDMAIVMKQQNRAEEAIEAIKSLRSRCSDQAQESLDNILLDLYKVRARTSSTLISLHVRSIHASGSETVLNLNAQRCGRLDDQISLLKHKLQLINQGHAFNGKRTKTARSQGRKFQVTLEQEATRLLVSARISQSYMASSFEFIPSTPSAQSCHCCCAG